jgi:hypothetical protein
MDTDINQIEYHTISSLLVLNIIYFVYKKCNFNFPLKSSHICDDFDETIVIMHNSVPYILLILFFICAINYNILFIIGYICFMMNIFIYITELIK